MAIRKAPEELGVKVICLAADNDFLSPRATERSEGIEHVIKCVDSAHQLGEGLFRITAGASRRSLARSLTVCNRHAMARGTCDTRAPEAFA